MKVLLSIVAFFLFVSTANANNYIRVTGEGATLEQAKENAFTEAIQIRVGMVVLSERESNLRKLEKDIVSVYSAGYVDDYKIIDISHTPRTVKLTVDVLVADSKLFNQTLSTGKTKDSIDGESAGARYQTYLNQKNKGDRILSRVLNTYPQNAFIVNQKPYRLSVDSFRNAVLEIPYQLKWNYDYIVALNEAMSLLEDSKFNFLQKAPSNIVIMAKNPKDLLIGEKNHYKFNDIPLLNNIKDSMTGDKEVRIMLTIADISNKILYKNCWIPYSLSGRKSSFYSIGIPEALIIYGNEKEENVLRIEIPPSHDYVIHRAKNVEVSVVPHNKC
jgi:hypothetical protein